MEIVIPNTSSSGLTREHLVTTFLVREWKHSKKNIDASICIGYQNALLHCSTNDLRDKSPGREAEDPELTDMEAHSAHLLQKLTK